MTKLVLEAYQADQVGGREADRPQRGRWKDLTARPPRRALLRGRSVERLGDRSEGGPHGDARCDLRDDAELGLAPGAEARDAQPRRHVARRDWKSDERLRLRAWVRSQGVLAVRARRRCGDRGRLGWLKRRIDGRRRFRGCGRVPPVDLGRHVPPSGRPRCDMRNGSVVRRREMPRELPVGFRRRAEHRQPDPQFDVFVGEGETVSCACKMGFVAVRDRCTNDLLRCDPK